MIAVTALPWVERAACIGYDPEWWFPHSGGQSRELKVALAICRSCPVRPECLTDALEAGPSAWGVWGGKTEDDRREMRGIQRKKVRA